MRKQITPLKLFLAIGATLVETNSAYADAPNGNFYATAGINNAYFSDGAYFNKATVETDIGYERNGFYGGITLTKLEDWQETSKYIGYFLENESGFSFDLEFSRTDYSDEYDDTYDEAAIRLNYKAVNLDYRIGRYGNFDEDELNYRYAAITYTHQRIHASYGRYGREIIGSFFELGYTKKVRDLSFQLKAVSIGKDLFGQCDSLGRDDDGLCQGDQVRGEKIILSIKRDFDF